MYNYTSRSPLIIAISAAAGAIALPLVVIKILITWRIGPVALVGVLVLVLPTIILWALIAFNRFGEYLYGRGASALCYASLVGDLLEVEELIEHGADIESVDPRGNTPLMLAVGRGHEKCVEAQLDHGANTKKRNRAGPKASDIARARGHHTLTLRLS